MAWGWRRSFRLIATGTILAALVFGAGTVHYLYTHSRDELLASAEMQLQETARGAGSEANRLFQSALSAVAQLEAANLQQLEIAEIERLFFAISSHPVRASAHLAGLYIGKADGSFLHVQNLIPTALTQPGALPTGYDNLIRRVIRRSGSDTADSWFYWDRSSSDWVRSPISPPAYDPRQRPWYRSAAERKGPTWTDPYVFASSGEIGLTFSIPIAAPSGEIWGVIGGDIAASSLTHVIRDYRWRNIGIDGFLFIGNEKGHVIAHSRLLESLASARETGTPVESAIDIRNLRRESGDDLVLFNSIDTTGQIHRARNGDKDILGIRFPLDETLQLPMFVYVGKPVDGILGDAVARLQRNVALLAALLLGMLVVAGYAAKLRHEVAVRKRTELALAEARDAAEAADRAKSSFLAMMSHEIRTPMNGVMSMAGILEQTDLTPDQRDMSSVIRESAAALLTIINDILDFSKIEAGKLEIENTPFSLVDVVEGAGELVGSRAEDKEIRLVIDLAPTVPDRLQGDPTRLRQILLNLLGNAVKFTSEGEVLLRVTVVERSSGSARFRFEVVDTGVGLTEEQRGRLFQAFAQADTSTSRKYGGTGLGLSISQRLCRMMGGTIGAESRPGSGSTFWFELPLTVLDARPDAPTIDVSDARIAAVGFHGTERRALAQLLRAAGIEDPIWLEAEPAASAIDDRFIVLTRAVGNADSVLGMPPLVGRGDDRRVILVAPRRLASTLGSATQRGFFATLTLPLRRHRLWHVLAAALGRAELETRRPAAGAEDIDWTPPTVEAARAAGALILVAEDNATNQTVIRRLLNQRGFAHEIAANGVEALRLFEIGGHGLLLTDFHMPDMDGFQLTAQIRFRQGASGRRLPIVALTADALPGTERMCLAAGMDGYLTKPIDVRALSETIEKFLPQALSLRVPRRDAATRAGKKGLEVDSEALDVARVNEIFGGVNDDALTFLARLAEDLPRMIDNIWDNLAAGDAAVARNAAHALKGAARSAGLSRLGGIAAEVQDCLDEGDPASARRLEVSSRRAADDLQSVLRRLRQQRAVKV